MSPLHPESGFTVPGGPFSTQCESQFSDEQTKTILRNVPAVAGF